MEKIVQSLAFILPIIALLSVVLLVLVNLYLKVRRHFPIRVNCWFCNQWTKVHYDEQNCFECPTCLQYNGFNSDGDYNKPIPAQQDELLNQRLSVPKNFNTSSSSNGLCHLCNNNQQLKMYQLANFIPLNEANYDVEIEHFQKQLEKAYKLCPPCETVLKSTLNKQSCLLGLRLGQLRKKGLLLLDLNGSHNGISKKMKWPFLKNLAYFTLIIFACLNLMFVVTKMGLSGKSLKKFAPKWMAICILATRDVYLTTFSFGEEVSLRILNSGGFKMLTDMYDYVVAVSQSLLNISAILEVPFLGQIISHLNCMWEKTIELVGSLHVIPEIPKAESATLLCSAGVVLQFISLFWSDSSSFKRKLFYFFLWNVLAYTHWNPPPKELYVYTNTLQIVTSIVIITMMCFARHSKILKKKLKHISKHKKSKVALSQLGELSDDEEVNTVPSHNSTFKLETYSNISTAKCTNEAKPMFGQPATIENQLFNQNSVYGARLNTRESLNQSFISAKSCISDQTSLPDTASIFSSSVYNRTSPNNTFREKDLDIDISLNKLHLGTPRIKKSPVINAFYTNNDVSRPRPVISPPKLKNVTQNSWVAGGFWRDSNGILLPLNNHSNLSRSSSQTSGFVSQTGPLEVNNYNSLPSSINNSFCGDFESNSVFSEPAYYMNGSCMMRGKNTSPRVACYNDLSRTFYPVLNHKQLVYISPYGFPNGVLNKNVNDKFSHFNLNTSGLEKSSFVAPSAVNAEMKVYKPGSLLKDWIDKMDS